MNKILNFKKKLQQSQQVSTESKDSNNNNNNINNNNNNSNNNNNNTNFDSTINNEKRAQTSKRVNKSNTPYISKSTKQTNSSACGRVMGGLSSSLFSKGKKSIEISNNRRAVQPFSDDHFLDSKPAPIQKAIQSTSTALNNNQNAHIKHPSIVPPPATSNCGNNKPNQACMNSQTESFEKKRAYSNIDKLIETSKEEYNIKVKEIEKKVIINTTNNNNNNNNNINHNNNQSIQILKNIISIEKQMISTLDAMIEDQINQQNTFKNIVNTSKKLSNHNFFNNNNNDNDNNYNNTNT